MSQFWIEFTTLALAHGLAVASPGPDFAIVTQHSLRAGRKTAAMTSLGIGTGILVHVAYALLGVGMLMQRTPLLFESLKIVGALYLLYLAALGLSARPNMPDPRTSETPAKPDVIPGITAFRQGFLTNVLNPKATLFFVSLFAVVISPESPRWALILYGLWMSLATTLWFTGVGYLFGHPTLRRALLRHTHWIDRGMGAVLGGLGLYILLYEQTLFSIAS